MITSIDSHANVKGITPEVRVVNWGDRITLRIRLGEVSVTWYLEPLTGESTEDYVQRVSDALREFAVLKSE